MTAAVLLHAGMLCARALPDGQILAAGDLRPGQDMAGEWTEPIDPDRDGQAGFHGGEAGAGHRRYEGTDVLAAWYAARAP